MKRNLIIIMICLIVLGSSVYGVTGVTLDYLYRYNCQQGQRVDHLLTALAISDTRAIVAGYPALALIDLTSLPVEGTMNYLDRISFNGEDFNARNLYFYHSINLNKDYVFVNENCMGTQTNPWGFAVVRIDPGDKLTPICRRAIDGVFFEKMFIAQDHLYIAAHNKGVYIYNIANPENPVLAGSFTDSRIVDAFSIAISNNKAYVADGAGGLKILNLLDAEHLSYYAGENTTTSVGTAEAITVKNGKVYMTLGTGYVNVGGVPTYYGLAVYNEGSITPRQLVSANNSFTEDLCWLTNNNYLAVSSYLGLLVYDTSTSPPTLVASELCSRREDSATLRFSTGLGSASNNRIMVANWNYLDIYQLKLSSASTQPDINSTEQRIRFGLTADTRPVTLTNNGQGNLIITDITSTSGAFTTGYIQGNTITLLPGDNYTFNISYNGSPDASGVIYIYSNDIDEDPLPIQVYGNLSGYLDPGDPATDFAVDLVTRNPTTGQFTVTPGGYHLADYRGKVVWFAVFGSWCPACMPAVTDMQNGVLKAFENNPNVVAKVYEVGGTHNETLSWLETVWSNYFLRSETLWEANGYNAQNVYKQPDTTIPFGRSYVIDQNGKIAGAYFGYDPTKAIAKINDLLAHPPAP